MTSRYIVDFDTKQINKYTSDVIIIGAGIGGLFTALNIDDNHKITLLSKSTSKENNSILAQGGIAVSVNSKIHFQDTLRAGGYINNQEAVGVLTSESKEAVEKLIDYGVNFDMDEMGRLKFTREGGHSQNNILHVKDATGREIIDVLEKEVRKRKNITIKEHNFAIDIITDGNTVQGILAINEEGQKVFYQGKIIVLATGGIGGVYKHTTNVEVLTGDGIAMAYRAGAKIANMEFVQFHPTALYEKQEGQSFLISEAVRGEGGILRNKKGESFMSKYHSMKELAPRDIVARSIFSEMRETNNPCVYIDLTHKTSKFIKNRFPNIYKYCIKKGIDITKDFIPVAPVQHYIMGGISTDTDGKTNIKGLYACGECSCTGVHGSNRLASNSLLEAIVFGNRVALAINEYLNQYVVDQYIDICHKNLEQYPKSYNAAEDVNTLKKRIQYRMDQYVAIVRSEKELRGALKEVKRLKKHLHWHKRQEMNCIEVINIATVAMLVIEGAINRQQNVGSHYRVG